MDADRNFKPFRWDLSRREQLPKVPLSSVAAYRHWPQVKYSPDFDRELRICAARVIAAGGDTDWVFVGRSPEHLFDYLSGVFESVSNAPSLTHLLFSLRYGRHRDRRLQTIPWPWRLWPVISPPRSSIQVPSPLAKGESLSLM